MYEYSGNVLDIHDGDTLHMLVDLGLDITVRMTIRLYGINAPELPTPEGVASKQFLIDTLFDRKTITLRTIKDHKEKYGRYLGILILADGTNVNELMVSSGHAVVYLP